MSSTFELAVLGSGGPTSFGRAASGYIVFVGGVARILVDAGPGAFVRMGEMGIDTSALDIVLLTHLHVDHSGDLPGVVKSRDLTSDGPLTTRIFGPSGHGVYPSTSAFVARLFGPEGAFSYLATFRNELGLTVTDLSLDAGQPPRGLLSEGGFRVLSTVTDHGDAPSVAYRIEYAGRSVVFSGDLASKSANLEHLAENTDLLVYNAVVRDPPSGPTGLYELHTAPRRIGEVAAAARAGALLLSHLSPSVDRAQEEVVSSIRTHYAGPVRFASDCLRVDLRR